jgi:hypothetical protein
VLRDDGHRIVAEEGRPAGDHLVERRTKRIQIAARVRSAAKRLLGRHVGDGTDHHPFLGHPRPIQRHGETEVAELRGAVVGEPDVPRLQIAVNDAACVRMLQRLTDLAADAQGLVDRNSGRAKLPLSRSVNVLWLGRSLALPTLALGL